MKYFFKAITIIKYFIISVSPLCILWLPNELIQKENNECMKFSVNCFITVLTFLSGILLIIMSLKYDTNNISNSRKDLLRIKLRQKNNFVIFLFFLYLITLIMLSLASFFSPLFIKITFILLMYSIILSIKLMYLIKEYCETEN